MGQCQRSSRFEIKKCLIHQAKILQQKKGGKKEGVVLNTNFDGYLMKKMWMDCEYGFLVG